MQIENAPLHSISDPDLSKIGPRIKEARERKGLTQEQLGEICDCGLKHISAVEKGRRSPSIKLLIKLSLALDVSVDYLLKDAGNTYIGYFVEEEFNPRLNQMDPKSRETLLTVMDCFIDVHGKRMLIEKN